MQTLKLLIALLLLALGQSCKKDPANTIEPTVPVKGEKAKSEHGQPVGAAVTASIGSGGGSIASADGRITLTVPAGAVEANTAFSVQPVENKLSGRGLSYRLLPENVTFKKDIAVRLSYAGADLAVSDAKYFFPAYQDAEGFWHQPAIVQHDQAAKTLTAQTKHFSDWTLYSRMNLTTDWRLVNGTAYMKKGNEMKLRVQNLFPVRKKDDPYDLDAALYVDYAFDLLSTFTWSQSSASGKLTRTAVQSIAGYKAPDAIARQEELMLTVTVSGETYGTDNLGQPVRQMMLSQKVVLQPEDEEYFELTADGNHLLHSLTASLVPGFMSIGGYLPGGQSVQMHLYGSTTGTYACGEALTNGKSTIEYSVPGGIGFICFRPETCSGSGNKILYSSGGVTLTKLAERVGDYTEGTVSTQLFDIDWCGRGQTKNISGRFKIRKR